jgi:orotate phosphoribosyltransferase
VLVRPPDRINFRSIADLDAAVRSIASQLPRDLGLIVGVPRSGMLAATMLALHLNCPLADLEGFLAGRTLGHGARAIDARRGRADGRYVVVIDDSILSGRQMRAVRALVAAMRPTHSILYAVAYATPSSTDLVDVYAEVVSSPRIFAWNILHHEGLLRCSCIDIDGVLCRDPLPDDNDDGPAYARFLDTASPFLLPSAPVRYVVTARLEKYRARTEAWLAQHGVEYESLVMLNLPTAAARREAGAHASHKAEFYRRSDATMFIESDAGQAAEIARLAARQVFAVDRGEMYYPGIGSALRRTPVWLLWRAVRPTPLGRLLRYGKRRSEL